MSRSLHVLAFTAVLVLACDAPATGPGDTSTSSRTAAAPSASVSEGDARIVSFGAMYGVDDAFVNHRQIRDVLGDELPWEVASANGFLTSGGRLVVHVRGVVFADVPDVPPELRGINDEARFRALVSCLVPGPDRVATANITTAGFPATRTGNSDIDTHVQLPPDCVAPIVFVLSGSEDKWFAVMGAEID